MYKDNDYYKKGISYLKQRNIVSATTIYSFLTDNSSAIIVAFNLCGGYDHRFPSKQFMLRVAFRPFPIIRRDQKAWLKNHSGRPDDF